MPDARPCPKPAVVGLRGGKFLAGLPGTPASDDAMLAGILGAKFCCAEFAFIAAIPTAISICNIHTTMCFI